MRAGSALRPEKGQPSGTKSTAPGLCPGSGPQGQMPPVPVTVGASLPGAAAPPPVPTGVTQDRREHPGRLQGPWACSSARLGWLGWRQEGSVCWGRGQRGQGDKPHTCAPGSAGALRGRGHQDRRQRSHTCAVCEKGHHGKQLKVPAQLPWAHGTVMELHVWAERTPTSSGCWDITTSSVSLAPAPWWSEGVGALQTHPAGV